MLTWQDHHRIAESLATAYPEVDPLEVRPIDLLKRVMSLPGFADDPQKATELTLSKIQRAWHDQYASNVDESDGGLY